MVCSRSRPLASGIQTPHCRANSMILVSCHGLASGVAAKCRRNFPAPGSGVLSTACSALSIYEYLDAWTLRSARASTPIHGRIGRNIEREGR